MKCLIVVSCLLVAVYGMSQEFQDKITKKMSEITQACVPEVGATDGDLSELLEKKMPTTKEGKCLIACYEKKLGVMKDGKFDKQSILAMMEPLKADDPDMYGKLIQVMDKCEEEVSKNPDTDECEQAAKGLACSMKAKKELGIDTDMI